MVPIQATRVKRAVETITVVVAGIAKSFAANLSNGQNQAQLTPIEHAVMDCAAFQCDSNPN